MQMSSFGVNPEDFYDTFDFYPCQCHSNPKNVIPPSYDIFYEYSNLIFTTMISRISIHTNCCNQDIVKDVCIDENDIHF